MTLDIDTKEGIAMDLASLSRYETLEVIEGRISESVINMFAGGANHLADVYRAGALQRLEVISQFGLLRKGRGHSSITTIQECIQRLDTFIEQQEVQANG